MVSDETRFQTSFILSSLPCFSLYEMLWFSGDLGRVPDFALLLSLSVRNLDHELAFTDYYLQIQKTVYKDL